MAPKFKDVDEARTKRLSFSTTWTAITITRQRLGISRRGNGSGCIRHRNRNN